MAEGVGFEPTEVLPSPVFKTGAFSRSATLPALYGRHDKATEGRRTLCELLFDARTNDYVCCNQWSG